METWTDEVPETITVTPAMVRKIARLTRLHPDAVIQIGQTTEEAIQVEFLDEYGHRVRQQPGSGRKHGHAFVIRENGWSNPSVKRATEALDYAAVMANAR